MRHFDTRRTHSKRWIRYPLFLVAVSIAALALASLGLAAKSGTADLSITKIDTPDPVSVGSPLTYTVQVQNFGPDAATGVTVTDQLPKDVDFVSATATTGQCARKGRKVSCDLGGIGVPTIDYSGGPTVTVAVIPRKIGVLTNTATVKAAQKDPVASNNKASATTSVVGPAATCRGVLATITGTAGDDTLAGTGGRDVIASFSGNDTIVSLAGRDLVCAGSGGDYVGAGPAADRVFGGAGSDRLIGRGGPDLLRGSAGNDVLKGDLGADRLRGGAGLDRCRGGAGPDSIRRCER